MSSKAVRLLSTQHPKVSTNDLSRKEGIRKGKRENAQ